MSILLLAGLILFFGPLLLMIGFAIFIFWGFMNDDPDAKGILMFGFILMGIGVFLMTGYFIGSWLELT